MDETQRERLVAELTEFGRVVSATAVGADPALIARHAERVAAALERQGEDRKEKNYHEGAYGDLR